MKTGARMLFFMAAILWLELSFAPKVFPEVIQTTESGAPQQLSTSVVVGRHLDLVSFSPVIVEGKRLGAIVVYDDPKTTRTDDYIELYDNSGTLVAVGWYDRFGIQRIAVDRGLLDDGYVLQGIFVTMASGDAI